MAVRNSQPTAPPATALDRLPAIALVVVAAATCLLLGSLSLRFLVKPQCVAPIWPVNAVIVVMLARLHRRRWHWVLLGQAMACLASNLIASNSIASSCIHVAGNVSETFLAAAIITRFGKDDVDFSDFPQVVRLFVAAWLGIVFAAALAAGAGFFQAKGIATFTFWQLRANADGLGILIVVPVLLSFPLRGRGRPTAASTAELTCLFAIFSLLCGLLLLRHMPAGVFIVNRPLMITVPFLLWTAVRTNVSVMSIIAMILAAFAVGGSLSGLGPFVAAEPNIQRALVILQMTLMVWTAVGLVIVVGMEEKRRVLQALALANELNDQIISSVQDGIIVMDLQLRYRVWSPSMERMRGIPAADVLGKTPMELFPFLKDAGVIAMLERARAGETISTPDFPYDVPQTGHKGWNWGLIGPLRAAEGKIIGVLVTVRESTERKHNEELLRQSGERFEVLAAASFEGIIIHKDGRIIDCNDQLARDFGYQRSELIGTQVDKFIAPEDRERILANVATGIDSDLEHGGVRKDGSRIIVEGRGRTATYGGKPVRITVLHDITHRVRMQEMAIQSEKMLSLGGLAAGMAHEINNPLAVMVQNAEVVWQRISSDTPQNRLAADRAGTSVAAIQQYMKDREILPMLQGIHDSGERAAAIVKNMLTFSRPRSTTMSPYRLDQLTDQALELMRSDYELKKRYDLGRIQVIREFDNTVPPVPCHAGEVQQVLLNLFKNAVHACAANPRDSAPPAITVQTRCENDHAVITVKDNGAGIPESIRRRIFEPFFTTKSPGEGTGLGLFISYFIISHHHSGTMRVSPNPGGGTRFEIVLPLNGREMAMASPTESSNAEPSNK